MADTGTDAAKLNERMAAASLQSPQGTGQELAKQNELPRLLTEDELRELEEHAATSKCPVSIALLQLVHKLRRRLQDGLPCPLNTAAFCERDLLTVLPGKILAQSLITAALPFVYQHESPTKIALMQESELVAWLGTDLDSAATKKVELEMLAASTLEIGCFNPVVPGILQFLSPSTSKVVCLVSLGSMSVVILLHAKQNKSTITFFEPDPAADPAFETPFLAFLRELLPSLMRVISSIHSDVKDSQWGRASWERMRRDPCRRQVANGPDSNLLALEALDKVYDCQMPVDDLLTAKEQQQHAVNLRQKLVEVFIQGLTPSSPSAKFPKLGFRGVPHPTSEGTTSGMPATGAGQHQIMSISGQYLVQSIDKMSNQLLENTWDIHGVAPYISSLLDEQKALLENGFQSLKETGEVVNSFRSMTPSNCPAWNGKRFSPRALDLIAQVLPRNEEMHWESCVALQLYSFNPGQSSVKDRLETLQKCFKAASSSTQQDSSGAWFYTIKMHANVPYADRRWFPFAGVPQTAARVFFAWEIRQQWALGEISPGARTVLLRSSADDMSVDALGEAAQEIKLLLRVAALRPSFPQPSRAEWDVRVAPSVLQTRPQDDGLCAAEMLRTVLVAREAIEPRRIAAAEADLLRSRYLGLVARVRLRGEAAGDVLAEF